MTAVAFQTYFDAPVVDVHLPDVDRPPGQPGRVISAVCPWCDTPRRTDKVSYFVVHRARRVKGVTYMGRPRVYVAVDECPGSGERVGETTPWDAT